MKKKSKTKNFHTHDHCSDLELDPWQLGIISIEDVPGSLLHHPDLRPQLRGAPDQRDHDLCLRRRRAVLCVFGFRGLFGRDLRRGLEDRLRLHPRDRRVDDAEPAASEAEHGVGLVERLDLFVDGLFFWCFFFDFFFSF